MATVREQITTRLESVGYVESAADEWIITYLTDRETQAICNYCNITVIPLGLETVLVERVCGQLLLQKQAAGQLTGTNFDASQAVKAITEGDTKVEFAVGSDPMTNDQRILNLFGSMASYGEEQLLCYRQLKW